MRYTREKSMGRPYVAIANLIMESSEGDIELAACIVYYSLENRRFSLLKLSQSYEHSAHVLRNGYHGLSL